MIAMPVGLFNSEYVSSIILSGMIILALFFLRGKKIVMFAFWFYVLSSFFLYRFDLHDVSFVADRFLYLPSLGFCIALGVLGEKALAKNKQATILIVITIFILLGIKTHTQTKIWKDDLSLWDFAVQHGPENDIVYKQRGIILGEMGEYDLAISDFNKALSIARDYGFVAAKIYNNRGAAYFKKGMMQEAFDDFNAAIYFKKDYLEAFLNRGNAHQSIGKIDLAISDYSRCIEIDPEWSIEPYNNRGALYGSQGKFEPALADFEQALLIEPDSKVALINKQTVLMDIEKRGNKK